MKCLLNIEDVYGCEVEQRQESLRDTGKTVSVLYEQLSFFSTNFCDPYE